MGQWKKLGEIFVEKGILSPLTVERMVAVSKREQKRFGKILEDLELVTADELAAAVAEQFSLPLVTDFGSKTYQQKLLRLITPAIAMENLIFPLCIEGSALGVAMVDPTDMRVPRNLAANNNMTMTPFVASRKDMYAAICRHYLGRDEEVSTKRTILVVEDDFFMRQIIMDILGNAGYRILTAEDGLEAYKEAMAKKPHVIITDKVMPKFDGYALFNSLKAMPETQSIPVILISGYMKAEDEAEAFNMGFFDVISKPINECTLLTRIKRAFWFYDHKYRLY